MRDQKPLSRTKKSQALQIARGHSELHSALAGRNRAVLAEPNLTDRARIHS